MFSTLISAFSLINNSNFIQASPIDEDNWWVRTVEEIPNSKELLNELIQNSIIYNNFERSFFRPLFACIDKADSIDGGFSTKKRWTLNIAHCTQKHINTECNNNCNHENVTNLSQTKYENVKNCHCHCTESVSASPKRSTIN